MAYRKSVPVALAVAPSVAPHQQREEARVDLVNSGQSVRYAHTRRRV